MAVVTPVVSVASPSAVSLSAEIEPKSQSMLRFVLIGAGPLLSLSLFALITAMMRGFR